MTRLLVGTYAAKGGAGLVPLFCDSEGANESSPLRGRIETVSDGIWRTGAPIGHVRNASFGLVSARHGHHYMVDEVAGRIAVYSASGGWAVLDDLPSGGEAPCHLALSPAEDAVAVANYASGDVALFPLDADGLPGTPRRWHDPGDGPDPERQAGPHAHWVGFGTEGDLITVDLGADRVFARRTGRGGGEVRSLYAAPRGSGPRHLAFHPERPVAYLVSELDATLTVLVPDGGVFRAAAILPIEPEDAPSDNLGGAIALDPAGTRLYASNRGHDSIATFALDATGMPSLIGHVPSGGRSPRFILPLPGRLAVANEESGTVALFRLDPLGCPLPDPEVLEVPGAAFLMPDLPGG
ncbi:hypothetical protein GCM10011380_09310 [Sphingomonas metalli]|uniref:Lactonase family protein n=1 Tax=Sphingomonas metalli TaxID=1779358 RepID=A0A916SY78_9SPHN|nr:beta-propeller fold lactonase family protein [Sphingomonas metalli]GGB21883.1 hypothetical protein GCM10011380_09310 [Sphingomonas metalli]